VTDRILSGAIPGYLLPEWYQSLRCYIQLLASSEWLVSNCDSLVAISSDTTVDNEDALCVQTVSYCHRSGELRHRSNSATPLHRSPPETAGRCAVGSRMSFPVATRAWSRLVSPGASRLPVCGQSILHPACDHSGLIRPTTSSRAGREARSSPCGRPACSTPAIREQLQEARPVGSP
jgi:hypothetical protein